MWFWANSEMLDLSKQLKPMTYTIQIPLQTTIELEICGGQVMSYSEIVSQITEVDLKEASLHLPIEDINSSFINAVAQDALKIEALTA